MTIEQANKQLEKVLTSSGDPEAAHSYEDDFYLEIIQNVAAGKDMTEQAKIALKTKETDFPRWCA